MLASAIQIGNSRGIRLPKRIFHELKIKDEVELIINKDKLIIKGVKKRPRQGWEEAFLKNLITERINYCFLKILTTKPLNGFGNGTIFHKHLLFLSSL